ncbi:hypothetical protein [Pararhizobium polonicum]|jgi:hypothetical protein|uniref:hypothetical protein n=1 Tax=Pararhizobium polonicum TaxID=1612624 RepID=UPI001314C1AA|nr:hypothetical protein [Pararhizobium polonicum]
MLNGHGAGVSRQFNGRDNAPAAHLQPAPAREDTAMLLRLSAVALLTVGAAATLIAFVQ